MAAAKSKRGQPGINWGDRRGGFNRRDRRNKSSSKDWQREEYVAREQERLKLDAIQLELTTNLPSLMDALGVDLLETQKTWTGPCPVHGGDNPHALNLYKEGYSLPGYWRCFTHQCHRIFAPTIIGFVRGVLSHRQFNWSSSESPRTQNFRETLEWCCQHLGQEYETFQVDYGELEKRKFTLSIESIFSAPEIILKGLSRYEVRERLRPPSPYFISRGWSPEIIDKYDVGLCTNPNRPFYQRSVVPVYNESGKVAVGYTARSIFEKCGKCQGYHDRGECNPESSKWRNSDGFSKENYLYNYWSSKRHIQQDACVIICEGPGDVWRLEESGIQNSVAIFGTSLSDQQQILLEMSGALRAIILTNMDEPGRMAANQIKKQLSRSFQTHIPELPKNDLGDLTPLEINQVLSGLRT